MASGPPWWGLSTGQGGLEDFWRAWGNQFPPLPHFRCVYPALPCCGLLPSPHLSLLAQPVSAPGPPLRPLARPGGPEDDPWRARAAAPRESAAALKAWLGRHRTNPYPSKGEKLLLGLASGMSPAQVSTWFANARRRLKKEPRAGPAAPQARAQPQAPPQAPPTAREAEIWRPAELPAGAREQGGTALPP